ncbi:MAG: hypothetical protein L6Q95_03070 [Planctomycetes bacterium]|nr:hypothetical protein [Planctomycetota bacterium]
MNARSILASLVALAATVSADSGGGGPPSPPCPALSVAPLVYVFVPDPLGARTWAERQMEAVRLGIGAGARERGSDGVVLADPARTRSDYALEMSEAPPDVPRRAEPLEPEEARPEEQRMKGALEAMGLKPEDLVEAPVMPAAVLALADILARVDALLFPMRPRERGADVASLRVDPEKRYVKQPSYLHYKMPPEDPEPKRPPLTLHAKRITRSLYKMLLGVAIGILIWGFVRNSA